MDRALTSGADPERLASALARLDRLVDWEARERSTMRQSLEPVRDLTRRLSNPERSFRAVHVAGTKGKGSVAMLVAHGLRAGGFAAGAYFSPHVERIHERIWIDGAAVEDRPLAEALERALAAREAALAEGTPAAEASWFDVLTAAAFAALAAAGVEWAVVEVGLGGRLDSTNVVDAEAVVVTNVELEHTALLGSTRRAIAREKAGVLKPGAVCVTGLPPGAALAPGTVGDEAAAALEARAAELSVAIVRPAPRRGAEPSICERNAALAGLVLDELGRRGVAARSGACAGRPLGAWLLVAELCRAARLPGRMERRRFGAVPVVLDGAHVPESLECVLRELTGERAGRDPPALDGPPVVVLGMRRDKDAERLSRPLAGRADRVLCTSLGEGPCRAPEEILAAIGHAGPAAEVVTPPRAALERAAALAGPRGWVLVTGSLHLVGALRPLTSPDTDASPCRPSSPTRCSPIRS